MILNGALFYHEHELNNGEIVRHAHPFLSEEEEQERNHSENELLLLDIISHATYFLPDQNVEVAYFLSSYRIDLPALYLTPPTFASCNILKLRGPPVNWIF